MEIKKQRDIKILLISFCIYINLLKANSGYDIIKQRRGYGIYSRKIDKRKSNLIPKGR